MPDRRTYGFNRDDATELVSSIGSRESWYPEIRPRATGGGGTKIISFTYSSAEPNSGAIVQIEQRAFPGPVFGSILEDSAVIVYDSDGCYFNEPGVDLLGRRGKAVLMLVDAEAAALHFPDDYDPPEYYWQVLSLCCDSTTCESET